MSTVRSYSVLYVTLNGVKDIKYYDARYRIGVLGTIALETLSAERLILHWCLLRVRYGTIFKIFCKDLALTRSYLQKMSRKRYYVYILSNTSRMLYIGITNNLTKRVRQHKQKLHDGYTQKYNLHKLIYYEEFRDVRKAIAREKELKG